MEQSPFGTFHSKSDAGAGRDRIETILIAKSRGLQYGVAITYPTKGAQGEQAFVFQTNFSSRRFINVFATDGAGRAGAAGHAMGGIEFLAGEIGRLLEGSLLKIARR